MSERPRPEINNAERPSGPGFSPILYDQDLRHKVAQNHADAEGISISFDSIWRGYDRVEHPWMHGRRAHDILKRVRGVFGRGE